jgi:hypothetical protein
LSCRNFTKDGRTITLEEILSEFIAAFLERGPGKRKIVRFAHSDYRCWPRKLVGPLVRVSSQIESEDLLPMELLTLERSQSIVDGRRIFKEAYWGEKGPLGDWEMSYRKV